MPKSCIICSVAASPDLQLQYCAQCQSALYCSRTCQRKDWKNRHKKICKRLNVGHGDLQLRSDVHEKRLIEMNEHFEINERGLDKEGNMKQFFKLFQESTLEGSEAAALDMTEIVKYRSTDNKMFLLFHSLQLLIRCSNSEMLSWPNSPLLVLLQFVDPSVLSRPSMLSRHEALQEDQSSFTPLHLLAELLDPRDYLTHVNQLILAEQLIKHGANVNAASIPNGVTPLHSACYADVVTNLDLVELLLVKGANPNAQSYLGKTPLMMTAADAPGAAKFLLNWPTTNINVTDESGESFIHMVRWMITFLTNHNARLDATLQLLLQQWRDLENMLVERGAH
jgi:hypothetical protein